MYTCWLRALKNTHKTNGYSSQPGSQQNYGYIHNIPSLLAFVTSEISPDVSPGGTMINKR